MGILQSHRRSCRGLPQELSHASPSGRVSMPVEWLCPQKQCSSDGHLAKCRRHNQCQHRSIQSLSATASILVNHVANAQRNFSLLLDLAICGNVFWNATVGPCNLRACVLERSKLKGNAAAASGSGTHGGDPQIRRMCEAKQETEPPV